MRYFEQHVLVEEATGNVVTERVFVDGTIEYWGAMTMGIIHNGKAGQAHFPVRIEIPDAFDIPNGKTMTDGEFADALRDACRSAAFANLGPALAAAEGPAKEQISQQIAKQQKQESSRIVLANSIPPTPITLQ